MVKFKLAIILLLIYFSLESSPLVIPVSFFNLSDERQADHLIGQEWNNKTIKISGFLYQLPDHKGIVLAPQPNLKSCCVGNKNKVYQQIFVKSDTLPLTTSAITLEGIFKIEPKYDMNGNLIQLYTLENPILLSHENVSFLFWVFILLTILIIVLGIRVVLIRKRSRKVSSTKESAQLL